MAHLLEIDSIRLLFGERLILSDVYLKAETGDVVGILGRNGSGKSCLMKIVYGTLKGDKSIRINNTPEHESYKKPQLIRYLPQHNFMQKSFTLKRIFSDFDVDFDQFSTIFPEFNGRIKSKIGELSGGAHRLVELYCIIKSNTRFVLLDEPFTHLNPMQIEKVKNIIREERKSKGFIVTDHMYRHVLDICDKTYLLRHGKVNLINGVDDLRKLEYITPPHSTRNPIASEFPASSTTVRRCVPLSGESSI